VGEAEAKPFLDAGEEHLRAGNHAAAERAFRDAVAAAPNSALAHSKLGVALAQQGQLDAAITEFSRAVAIHPGYAPGYSNLGNAYREKGMTAEAVAAYERAVALDPDYWIAHQNLGALYKQMGRVGDAVEHFKKATRLSMRQPSSSEAGSTGTRRRLGCLPGLIAAGAAMAILTGILRALPLL
jgi:tetratricopeptide (TPR) repeat protein